MTSEENTTFDAEFDKYLHRLFWVTPSPENDECDPSIVECFGVLSLNDMRQPDRKLWYMYYCKQPEVDETLDRIFKKYGKKNLREIFRKPVFSGVGLRSRVKTHFREKKWLVKGNLLEAPRNSPYNDDKMTRHVTDMYEQERKFLFNFVIMNHNEQMKYS